MRQQRTQQPYWIVVAGLAGAGKTTFVRQAADTISVRDRQDMSLITEADHMRVLEWLHRTGGATDPDQGFITPEEQLFARWMRRVTIGEIFVDTDLHVWLYEAPGTRDFDFLWQVISPETYMGTIILLDSANHASLRDASRLAATFAAYADEPYIFAANKQDDQNAMPPEDIGTLLHFLDGHTAPVVPCIGKNTWAVKRTMIRLLELIRETYDDGILW